MRPMDIELMTKALLALIDGDKGRARECLGDLGDADLQSIIDAGQELSMLAFVVAVENAHDA